MSHPPKASPTLVQQPEDIPAIDIRNSALVVVEGPDQGASLDPLPPRVLIGRSPWCDLQLDDARVSGTHCELLVDGEGARVRDLGSTNGVWLDPNRVFDAALAPGAVFRVGGSCIRLDLRAERRRVPRPRTDPSGALIGGAPSMQRMFDMMARVAGRDLAVLLLGETGTGKSAVAAALHRIGDRADGPLVPLNCGALPPHLVESTLFGHVKGSFTGAHRDADGVFVQANGGTLFLDEVGELPLELQPKLLQALETRRVRPVGSQRDVEVDFRLVSATNRPLWSDVNEGRFRRDLYFRIAGIEITVPPLRDRTADLPALCERLLEAESPGAAARLGEAALRRLRSHPWPGNVRELQNVLVRASVLAGEGRIEPEHLVIHGWETDASPPTATEAPDAEPLDLPFKAFKTALLARHERRYFERLMERCEGNITRGAREAEISRTHLLTMLRRHDLYDRS